MTAYGVCVMALGLIVGFYWGRVIKLVFKTRRTTGRSAQFVPREGLGRALRVLWYPTVLTWVLHPWLTLLVGPAPVAAESTWYLRAVNPLWASPWQAGAGLMVAGGALWATLVCWRRMGKSWRMGINPGEKTELIVSGPYAYVAHPIYALQQVLVLASFCVIPSPVMLGVAVVELVFLQWEARREERYLRSVHPEAYGRYLTQVGRFVPRWGRRAGALTGA